jgi:hypothetical protein
MRTGETVGCYRGSYLLVLLSTFGDDEGEKEENSMRVEGISEEGRKRKKGTYRQK